MMLWCMSCSGKEADSGSDDQICGPGTVSVDGVCLPEDSDTGDPVDTGLDSGDPQEPGPIISVDSACGTDEVGHDAPSDDAVEALERTNCYRNVMGLVPAVLDPALDAAAQAHADYMLLHDTLGHSESSALEGYTGDHVWDRMEAAGYALEGGNTWSEVVARGYTPTEAIDRWMSTVYHRESFTVTTWRASGFGYAGDYSAMAQVMPYPDPVRQAVVFPVDGQTEVPVSFDSDTENPDPAPDHGIVGYPVTVTVTHTEVVRDDHNKYDLRLDTAVLWGPDGDEVEVLILTPEDDEDLASMVALVPLSPLQIEATYRAEIAVTWGGGSQTLVTEFRTGTR
jgi:uncharacterized protein YkwD